MVTSTQLVELGRRMPISVYLRAVWRRREFALALPLNELRAQNMDTVLGNLWHLLNPLLLLSVYALVFGVVLDVGERGLDDVHYVAFLSVGIFLFQYTQKSTVQGAKSIVSNVGLIRSMQFPRAILPLSAVIQESLALLPALVLMLVVVLVFGVSPTPLWVLLVPLVALQALFNLGAAFYVARFTEGFRDLQNVLPYFFRILFYVSGILFFAPEYVAPEVLPWFSLNPLYAFVSAGRDIVLMGSLELWPWVVITCWTVLLVVTGFMFFRAHEHRYGRG